MPKTYAPAAFGYSGQPTQKARMLASQLGLRIPNYMIEKDKVVVLISTCPNAEVAESIARALVTEQLAACVNQLPGVRSIYRWQGQVQSDSEVLLMIKSVESRVEALKTRLIKLHPYELPEVITLPVCGGSEPYLEWLRQTVAPHET